MAAWSIWLDRPGGRIMIPRHHCLIIILICFICCGLIAPQMSWGDTSADVYALWVNADELGYDPGPAVRAEVEYRPIKYTSIQIYGQYAWIHKKPHDTGHHEWYGGSLRAYPWQDVFVGG